MSYSVSFSPVTLPFTGQFKPLLSHRNTGLSQFTPSQKSFAGPNFCKFHRRNYLSKFQFSASRDDSKFTEGEIELEKDDQSGKASQEAWEQVLSSSKEQALKLQSVSQEAFKEYSKKAAVVLKQIVCSNFSGMPGVLSVKPDPGVHSFNKDYSYNFNLEENSVPLQTVLLFPEGSKHWLVCVEKPSSRAFSKAQMVDFYVDMLTRVLRNEKDAQMCLYHISSQSEHGFCCMLDEECAQELAAVPGVLSVQPDENFESENKDYGGGRLSPDAPTSVLTDMSKTKLFITGLSFYTSEKTLREAFEPFGELIKVKIIMDKISKRSKGYAFVEFTSEDAATTALREMHGKIINGWMIVVDRARTKPRLNRGP